MIEKKLVVVGDGACGKTCLLTVFKKGVFPHDYEPTIFETDVATIEINKKKVIRIRIEFFINENHQISLALWDTAGQEEYARLRPLSYPDTDIVLICFNLADPDSFLNVLQKWVPEVHHFCPRTPYILVGNKKDLRSDKQIRQELKNSKKSPITEEEGVRMAKEIKACAYVECSALLNENVNKVFEEAARAAVKMKNRHRFYCVLL
ncbi:Rho1-like protein [Dinothrombium tinctorium]|uniref:Rho1-like protein n=1 Tax=Dinothrombium tinctorium TaxID=1965070 RepID=A0A3S3NVI5_9ACAR|nr:Rho1-like protein [Dinothrombium tinctorium]RWS01972.1 Rho1-like protein [Dinothrombium tinctorium]RWS06855.1 Rho1-like protein [Dinothrombium tinctorium]